MHAIESRESVSAGPRTERTKRICMWLQLWNVKSTRYMWEIKKGKIEPNVHDATVDWLSECLRFIDIWLKFFFVLVLHVRYLSTRSHARIDSNSRSVWVGRARGASRIFTSIIRGFDRIELLLILGLNTVAVAGVCWCWRCPSEEFSLPTPTDM